MNSKRNQILIGVILLLVGIISLWQDVFKINYGSMLFFMLFFLSGFAFLLLYRTKRKNWSLILGSHLVYVSAMIFKIGDFSLSPILLPAMFFIVPAFIFLVLYFDKNKLGLLLPGSIFMWFGIFIIISRVGFLQPVNGVLFFVCMGAAFFMARVLGKAFLGRWAEGMYVVCFSLAILQLLNLPHLKFILGFMPQIGSILVIIASIVIIVKAVRKK